MTEPSPVQPLHAWLHEYRRSAGSVFERGLERAADALVERCNQSDVETVLDALRALSRLSPDPATVAATLLLPLDGKLGESP
ncbi:MAG: hypothetical protein V2J10_03795, partial [Wenzhouxiangella sp.]|nr:hypothetical protein [Wenzhouxiangella sp.]